MIGDLAPPPRGICVPRVLRPRILGHPPSIHLYQQVSSNGMHANSERALNIQSWQRAGLPKKSNTAENRVEQAEKTARARALAQAPPLCLRGLQKLLKARSLRKRQRQQARAEERRKHRKITTPARDNAGLLEWVREHQGGSWGVHVLAKTSMPQKKQAAIQPWPMP